LSDYYFWLGSFNSNLLLGSRKERNKEEIREPKTEEAKKATLCGSKKQ